MVKNFYQIIALLLVSHNKDFETDSPIVTVLASAAPARTRANYGSRLKSLLYRLKNIL
jgi:hypothetical protein